MWCRIYFFCFIGGLLYDDDNDDDNDDDDDDVCVCVCDYGCRLLNRNDLIS